MKLKTLKNIEFDCSAVDKYATIWKAVDRDVLRQELGIKWVKRLQYAVENDGKRMPEIFIPYANLPDWREQTTAVINFIKYILNITDKDLE